MADDNKKSDDWKLDADEWIIVFLFILAILSTIVPLIVSYISSGQVSFFGLKISSIWNWLKSSVPFLRMLGFGITIAAAVGVIVFNKKSEIILQAQRAKLYPEKMPQVSDAVEPAKNHVVEKWEEIVKLSESQNSSDWRLAIIEADILLDELLNKLQLPGDTTGEKLKAVEPSDFTTIESAWEAHKARNVIAHEGSNILFNQREALRIVSLYEAVFKEFKMI